MMRLLSFFLSAHLIFAQAFATGSSTPNSRVSFLREQFGSYDPALILDLPMTSAYQATSWTDRTGKYTATLNGSLQTPVAGKIGPWAPYFNRGVPNFLVVSPTPTIPSSFTAMAWVHANAPTGGFNRIIDANYKLGLSILTNSSTSPTQYQVIIGATASGGLGTCTSSTAAINLPGSTVSGYLNGAWPNNKWDFVAVTYNGSTAILYVNGASAARGSGCNFTYTGAANPLYIGNCYNAGADANDCNSDHWDGEIQGVRIVGRVLTAAELAAIYAAENH